MSTIVLRSVKGTPLTNAEVDANFTNLNNDKTELGGTYSSGTANGVLFLNGSKVLTTGSALTFDGTTLGVTTGVSVGSGASNTYIAGKILQFYNTGSGGDGTIKAADDASSVVAIGINKTELKFYSSGSEQMRLTSTGLGIGTSSPTERLTVNGGMFSVTRGSNGTSASFNAGDGTNDTTLLINHSASGITLRNSNPHTGGYNNLIFANTTVGETMRIDPNGNLGIGTSSPTERLQVAGSIRATGAVTANATGGILAYQGSSTVMLGSWGADASTLGAIQFYQANSTGTINRTGMLLDTSGNLGLGVTPSAWTSSIKALQVSPRAAIWGDSAQTILSHNMFVPVGGVDSYIGDGFATLFTQINGAYRWFQAPSGTAGDAISFSQVMTLDASGNFYVGTTSQSGGSNITFNQPANADMKIAAAVSTGTRASYQVFVNNTVTTVGTENSSGGSLASGTSAYSTVLANSGAYPISFATNNTERARIDSSGNLLIGKTADVLSNAGGFLDSRGSFTFTRADAAVGYVNRLNSDGESLIFMRSTTQVGSISVTTTATAYNTSSDYRLKNTIAPMTGALAKVALLKPCTYKWNADGSDGEGFIAHELQAVVPQCVTGVKDAVDAEGKPQYQGIDTSFLVATLTAAIQELKAEFDAYKASHP
jgi:hypothetical protein